MSATSSIETFVALTLEVHTWRWHGVPFILRTGKRLARRLTEIRVKFRQPPVVFFKAIEGTEIHSNELVISVQPDEGFDLIFEVKSPGPDVKVATEKMSFRYAQAFAPLPDGYQTLLLEVFRGDTTLFVRADEVEASWAVYAPLLENPPKPVPYAAGSAGPGGVQVPFDPVASATSTDHAA